MAQISKAGTFTQAKNSTTIQTVISWTDHLGDLNNLITLVVQVSSTETYSVNSISSNYTFTGATCSATIISPVKYLPNTTDSATDL